MPSKWFVSMLLLSLSPAAFTAAQTPRDRVALVELFTSEGCSSCPPADALLRRVNGTRTAEGVLTIGLSEHVTYWNSLGWADPFSGAAYTARQSAYSERFGLDSVYTPQVVVNGQQQIVGGNEQALLEAIRTSSTGGGVALQIQTAAVEGSQVRVAYTVSGSIPPKTELWAAVTDDMATSSVTRGENGGRTLTHVSVARSLTKVGTLAAGTQTFSVPNPAVLQGQRKTGRHLVLFAQERGAGKIFAVESRPL